MSTTSKAQLVRDEIARNPNLSSAQIAEKLGLKRQFVYQVRWVLSKKKTAKKPRAKAQVPLTTAPAELAMVIEPPAMGLVSGVDEILVQRGLRYGKFKDRAQLCQELKRVMVRHAQVLGTTFTDSQWEALEMIAHKIARIVNGDPNHVDSWTDIAGYAKLIADELDGIER